MNRIRTTFIAVVAVVVLVLFAVALGFGGYYTFWCASCKPNDMPSIVSSFVSSVNAILLANLGAVLGISLLPKPEDDSLSMAEKLQWFAAGWYILMLIVAAVAWGAKHFDDSADTIVAFFPDMTRTGVGVLIAILGAALGVQVALRFARRPTNPD